jgi:uncharacterized RDD family membrane protein YckC
MPSNRSLVIPAALAGLAFVVIAIIYFADSAAALPSFFPGHEAGVAHHHVKHGLAALIVGLAAFVFAWFQTGPAHRQADAVGG